MATEELIAKYDNCRCFTSGFSVGSIEVTNYRLAFVTSRGVRSASSSVPLTTIQSYELKRSRRRDQASQQSGLFLYCKDMRIIRFVLPDLRVRDELARYINEVIRPVYRTQPLFAYVFAEVCLAKNLYLESGWNIYSPEEEYQRQNVMNNGWRISKVNDGYKVCRSYPEVLVVPAKASDEVVAGSAGHRGGGGRAPVLAWLHPEARASLTRAAQPLPGPPPPPTAAAATAGRRCAADEELLRCIREANANTLNLLVFDARPQFTAAMNRGRGGGVENPAFYSNIQYSFMNIPNANAMRASFARLMNAVTSVSDTAVGGTNWLRTIHDTKWLYNIQQILSAAAAAADQIENHKSSVLVHCSDGWDLTPQVTSLAMLMLDPYYRTLRGFQVLVEKEWISFGHKFCQRTGGPADGGHLIIPNAPPPLTTNAAATAAKISLSSPEERSPIFLQFIDCVWQMTVQFPAAFEFNEAFLITILDELYACRFGTFLFDSECEARNNQARSRTISLWGYVNANAKAYLNPVYTPAEVSGHRLIIPCAMSVRLKLWKGYYLRWQPFMRCQEPLVSHSAAMLERMQRFRALARANKRGAVQEGNLTAGGEGGNNSVASLPAGANGETRDPAPPSSAVRSAISPRRIFPRFPISNASAVAGGGEKADAVTAHT